ncbi:metallophosphoesterase [Budvicia aquatica]|uniref:Calcineurin-like phosphoesterase superfamily domain n=1 Tax=Budvicia aquatica TaxID=82979 RepID=A0A2C6DR23_9GAMM|nr:metallophosphoesterase [Budvicia aquatica]PHI30895.1 metallophosphoesterase [Budvicia aquatica]VFS50791.1 Calcineurin-like phosphoesterase superfamily domain [Budvicia aquatica]
MLLLHLSDIHFRREEISTPLDPNRHIRNELLLDAEKMCTLLDKTPSAILISGDIAFAAHSDEYAYALTWLEQLAKACGTGIENVFIIPGNHDVARDKSSAKIVQALHKEIKTTPPSLLDGVMRGLLLDEDSSKHLYSSLNEYNSFAVQFFCDVNAPHRTMTTRDLELNDGSILRLLGFNSALVSSKFDEPGSLYVDPACFQVVREKGVEHIVLCHHPFSWLGHGEELQNHLNDISRIQLFGHNHTSRIELQDDFIRISASAAQPNKEEYGWEPGYNLIEINVNSDGDYRELDIIAHIRIWQSSPGQFIAKMRKNDDHYRKKIHLDNWSRPESKLTDSNIASIFEKESLQSISAAKVSKPVSSWRDPMDKLRIVSVRFYKLTLSQKLTIARKLGLLEDEDRDQSNFERFRRVFILAQQRDLIGELDNEISTIIANVTNSNIGRMSRGRL